MRVALTLKSDDGKTAMDLAMEAEHEKPPYCSERELRRGSSRIRDKSHRCIHGFRNRATVRFSFTNLTKKVLMHVVLMTNS